MKDGFKSLEIKPEDGYLDYIGPASSTLENANNRSTRLLKGQVKFTLSKSVKIKSMSVKFKGFTGVHLKKPHAIDITCPLLPKLKVPLFGRTTLPAGDHIIPWEVDIPNIYPRSLLTKRGNIYYKIVVFVGIGIARSLTAEYPIVIRRHLLPYKELSPLIETKLFTRTIPGKFHYEIDIPQIVCIEQEYMPMAVKYVCIANQKPLQAIRTRLIQIEAYKRQLLNKQELDLTSNNKDVHIFDLDQKVTELASYKESHVLFMKKTSSAIIHTPDNDTTAWKKPCLIKHNLNPYFAYTLSSPLISIYHHLELTFQFGMVFEEIKIKIPIIIASVPRQEHIDVGYRKTILPPYAFEDSTNAHYLTSKLVPHSMIKSDDQKDNSYSISKEFGDMSEDDEGGLITGRATPIMFARAGPSCRAMSPPLEKTPKQIKKFASALDLSTSDQNSFQHDFGDSMDERPRATTPTSKKQARTSRKLLAPIDVNLANGKETSYPAGSSLRPPPKKQLPLLPGQGKESGSSDILPPSDRVERKQLRVNESIDDLRSSCSDSSASSSNNAPSLSSSVTLSTNKSHLTLHSRPPSPVFSPAPGLPATIELRPQQQNDAEAIEEQFPSDPIISPALNTVASSTVLTPSNSTQRRIALSIISSLTNESMQSGRSNLSNNNAGRLSSAVVDPDMHFFIQETQPQIFDLPPPPPQKYLSAELPPIPSTATSPTASENRRMTRLYMDDSDDEDNEEGVARSPPPLPPIPSYNRYNDQDTDSNSTSQESSPPRLPRLSFGTDFGLSLDIL